jgi:Asp-tRNA(Asn)/Glu-tRNA(Gln) amidotransferase A subunit family amidase
MTDLASLTATEARRRIEGGRVVASALLEACLDRIASREGVVHAFSHFDISSTRMCMTRPGVLAGLPIGVKDVLDTADMPSEYGSPIWAAHRPRADAACVAWARAAGALVMGKTVTTEFATRKPGPTTNPHNPAHTPGGSSSGSAAGVAAGFFPLAFGTQTAGSIIRPAAFCGVVGYKPSYGTIARQGMKVMAESLDTIGVMARCVADCALFAGAVAGRDLGNPDLSPERMPRLGLCRSPVWAKAAPETVALWDEVERALGRAGAHLEGRELPREYDALEAAHVVVMNAESAASMGWELCFRPEGISGVLRERLNWGLAQGPDRLDGARATVVELQERFAAVMDGLDVLMTPSAPGEAPEGLDWTGDPAFNAGWTALGVPCVTVPAGTGPKGLPLGIQLVGRRGDDAAVLAWARFVAAALS